MWRHYGLMFESKEFVAGGRGAHRTEPEGIPLRSPRGCYPPTLSGGCQWYEPHESKPLHRWMAR